MNSQKTNTRKFVEHMYPFQTSLNNAKKAISINIEKPSNADVYNYLVALQGWDKAYVSYMRTNDQLTSEKFAELSETFASWYTEHYHKDSTITKTYYAISTVMQIATKRCGLNEFEEQNCAILQEDIDQMFSRFVNLPEIDVA